MAHTTTTSVTFVRQWDIRGLPESALVSPALFMHGAWGTACFEKDAISATGQRAIKMTVPFNNKQRALATDYFRRHGVRGESCGPLLDVLDAGVVFNTKGVPATEAVGNTIFMDGDRWTVEAVHRVKGLKVKNSAGKVRHANDDSKWEWTTTKKSRIDAIVELNQKLGVWPILDLSDLSSFLDAVPEAGAYLTVADRALLATASAIPCTECRPPPISSTYASLAATGQPTACFKCGCEYDGVLQVRV